MEEISLKILVPKKQFDELVAFKRSHIDCHSPLTKYGKGSSCSKVKTSKVATKIDTTCECDDDSDCCGDVQENPDIQKSIILQRQPVTSRSENFQDSSQKETELDVQTIVSFLRKRYQNQGRKLLLKLQILGSVQWDKNGIVSLDEREISGSSIFELLASVFYTNRTKTISGLEQWKNFLQKNDLMSFVKNPDLLEEENPVPTQWWFLGSID